MQFTYSTIESGHGQKGGLLYACVKVSLKLINCVIYRGIAGIIKLVGLNMNYKFFAS